MATWLWQRLFWSLLFLWCLHSIQCRTRLSVNSILTRCFRKMNWTEMTLEEQLYQRKVDSTIHISGIGEFKTPHLGRCFRKIAVLLKITNENEPAREEDMIMIDHVHDSVTEEKIKLLHPLAIKFRQSCPQVLYPFRFLKAVNGRPYEVVESKDTTANYSGCDDTSPVIASCGHSFKEGNIIERSQGFCCPCPNHPFNDTGLRKIRATRSNMEGARGNQNCTDTDIPPTVDNIPRYFASAHCLKFSNIWYSVNALGPPFEDHEVYLQVYVQDLENTTSWKEISDGEYFTVSRNRNFISRNASLLANYIYLPLKDEILPLDIVRQRLLIPQPDPLFDPQNLPPPIENGACDYLVVDRDKISLRGQCDKVGINYKAFASQKARCSFPAGTCFQEQPLDFWESDNELRMRGMRGSYLLENFGTLAENPIIVDQVTNEHFISFEPNAIHDSYVYMEINADRIVALRPGYYAQLSSVFVISGINRYEFIVQVTNMGLVSSCFAVKINNCSHNVLDSDPVKRLVLPQNLEEFVIVMDVPEMNSNIPIQCIVELTNEKGRSIAIRQIHFLPFNRCICLLHCSCKCYPTEDLGCIPLSLYHYYAAGFVGSIPIRKLTHSWKWYLRHFLTILKMGFLIWLILMLLGLIKALLGLLNRFCATCGLFICLGKPRKLDKYYEPNLKSQEVVYNEWGIPVHPETKKPCVRQVPLWVEFIWNVFYFLYAPFTLPFLCLRKLKCPRMERLRETHKDIPCFQGFLGPSQKPTKDQPVNQTGGSEIPLTSKTSRLNTNQYNRSGGQESKDRASGPGLRVSASAKERPAEIVQVPDKSASDPFPKPPSLQNERGISGSSRSKLTQEAVFHPSHLTNIPAEPNIKETITPSTIKNPFNVGQAGAIGDINKSFLSSIIVQHAQPGFGLKYIPEETAAKTIHSQLDSNSKMVKASISNVDRETSGKTAFSCVLSTPPTVPSPPMPTIRPPTPPLPVIAPPSCSDLPSPASPTKPPSTPVLKEGSSKPLSDISWPPKFPSTNESPPLEPFVLVPTDDDTRLWRKCPPKDNNYSSLSSPSTSKQPWVSQCPLSLSSSTSSSSQNSASSLLLLPSSCTALLGHARSHWGSDSDILEKSSTSTTEDTQLGTAFSRNNLSDSEMPLILSDVLENKQAETQKHSKKALKFIKSTLKQKRIYYNYQEEDNHKSFSLLGKFKIGRKGFVFDVGDNIYKLWEISEGEKLLLNPPCLLENRLLKKKLGWHSALTRISSKPKFPCINVKDEEPSTLP